MTKLILDADTLAKLHNLDAVLEVCDESGQTLGYFHPLAGLRTSAGQTTRSPFTDQEVQQRRQQRTGRPLSEILGKLHQS